MDVLSTDSTGVPREFQEFISALNANKVVYVLVGGFAVGWHGFVRATADIDFLYERSRKNVDRLCAAMEEFGAPANLIDVDFLMSANAITQIGIPPRRIDLLASIDGVSFKKVRAGAVLANFEGYRIRVIGLRELRLNKKAAGRPKDKIDLDGLAKGRKTT